jgi:two-component system, NtrC family, sensor kinase
MDRPPPVRILLVEDSEMDAQLIEAYLQAHGLVCELTRIEALEPLRAALQKPDWDILLTDYMLPGMDGLQVISEAQRLAPALPCIIVSGQIGEEAAVEALRAGAKDFINKSRLARLLPAMRRELEDSQARARAKVTRTELRTSEDRFKAITSAALDGIVMIDPEGRISFWNPAASSLFGYTEAEALGKDLHDLLAPSRFQTEIRTGFGQFQNSGQGVDIGKVSEVEARRKDGTEFPAELSLSALQVGEAWHAVGVVRDITARRALELEQFEHLQFLHTLIETVPSPLYYEDLDGTVLGFNRALQEFVGLPTDRILHQKAKALLPLLDAGQTGELGIEGSGPQEAFIRTSLPDGRISHAIFRRAQYCHADGRPAGYVATIMDISKLKETEQALRRNEWLFSMIHRHVVELVAIFDGEGRRVYTSPSYQHVLGYSEQELSKQTVLELLHPEDVERVAKVFLTPLAGRPTQRTEYRLRHKDGRWLTFESTAAIVPDPENGTFKSLVVARDISERKEAEMNQAVMEAQLRQSQKLEAIGQLAAGIAHEINTPTQFIGDNTTFLRDAFKETFDLVAKLSARLTMMAQGAGAGRAEAQAALAEVAAADVEYLRGEIPKAIQQCLDGVGRIAKIVKAMKDFAHPGGETKTPTDLQQAIESTITVSRTEWKYVANLVTDFAQDLPLVPCFADEFNQVILNLVVNAAHAIESAKERRKTGALGQITVRTKAGQGEVEISVSDDGTGISKEVQAHMFELFYTTKPVGKGSGQGLAIAHTVIVEKHQGRIEVESEVGRGTTFRIFLPLGATDH